LLRIIPSLALFEVALLYRRFAEIPGFDRIFKWPEAITPLEPQRKQIPQKAQLQSLRSV
jgi:hypothetical protein